MSSQHGVQSGHSPYIVLMQMHDGVMYFTLIDHGKI